MILIPITLLAPLMAGVARGDKVGIGLGIGTAIAVLAGWVALSIRSERGGN
jgi:hypothetical protein